MQLFSSEKMHSVDSKAPFVLQAESLADSDCGNLLPEALASNLSKASRSRQFQFEKLLERLSKSAFRRRFHLDAAERQSVARLGLAVLRRHAHEIISKRLAKAVIANDGRQTPMRGYPVFKAQHALGLCCRQCLKKWHGIEPGRELTPQEIDWAADLIVRWIEREMNCAAPQVSARAKNSFGKRQRELDFL